MGVQRKVHSAGIKAKVALAAHKADRTVNQLAGHFTFSNHARLHQSLGYRPLAAVYETSVPWN
jgi:hypothetical protein